MKQNSTAETNYIPIRSGSVDDESVPLSAGQCAVVPEMVPHSVENVADETARVVGFFPDDELTATFDDVLMPFESNVVSIGHEEP